MDMIKLIAFLGNPGTDYVRTRHNIGWMLADIFTYTKDIQWHDKHKGLLASERVADDIRYFLKPMTFMNRSGSSLKHVMEYYNLTAAELLVVHDDIELPFGIAGFKFSGGLSGHNGLRSITDHLATRDYFRFRLGVSRPGHTDIASYVLSAFSADEQNVLPTFLENASDLLVSNLWELDHAVNQHPKIDLLES